MRKKVRFAALLAALALLAGGCMTSPPDALLRVGAEGQTLISANTEELSADSREMTLYFRYGDSGYLAPEQRIIQVRRNESLEKALVEALIQGPAAPSLNPLFPAGTEVLAAASQGDTLFITLSEAFLGRYTDEPDTVTAYWREEGPLRRLLCLDSLAATLTEAGLCAQAQVLVYRKANQSTSMRLQAGFLDRSQDETLLPPVVRNEENLLTPYNTAKLILQAWLSQDWAALYDWTARESADRPMEQTAFDAFAAARGLADFSLSPGTVSYDGQTAVMTVDLTMLADGQEIARGGYPMLLRREGGRWKIDYPRLIAMMNDDW